MRCYPHTLWVQKQIVLGQMIGMEIMIYVLLELVPANVL